MSRVTEKAAADGNTMYSPAPGMPVVIGQMCLVRFSLEKLFGMVSSKLPSHRRLRTHRRVYREQMLTTRNGKRNILMLYSKLFHF